MSEGTGGTTTPPGVDFSPEEVERIRRQNLENIRARAMRGETLTDSQHRLLDDAAKGGAAPSPAGADAVFVATQQLLADALGLADRKTVQRWLKEGAPAATDDGRYNVTDWRIWMQEKGRGTHRKKDDAESVKTQAALVDLRIKQIELEQLQGSKLDLEEAVEVTCEMWSRFAQALRALKHELAPAVVGETVPEATKRIGASFDALLNTLSVPEASKKKAFWRNVSAKLFDLRQTYLRSPTPRKTSAFTTAATATPT